MTSNFSSGWSVDVCKDGRGRVNATGGQGCTRWGL